jgi:5-(carboxyamino)imidazole ribonucleotide synthase
VKKTHLDVVVSPAMKPIGLLGGGQLARMLALKAHEMGLPVAVLSEKADDPAAQVVSQHFRGQLDDRATLKAFLKKCAVVTFESEFLDAGLLGALASETGTRIYPEPQHMGLLQDRLSQKQLLKKHGLATSPFHEVSDEKSARAAFQSFKGQVVFKKRRFGYDGYGTFVVRNEAALENFCVRELPASAKNNPHGFIAERFIPFKRELAAMVVRGAGGETARLPFVETFQEHSRCLWVKGPLRESAAFTSLGKKLERFLQAIGYVGIMGVELFDTGKELLVNELAPRVHNSGHYSLDALSVDQFSLHLKAVLGLEIAKPAPLAKGFAMWNLLGSHESPPEWILPPDVKLHWYGKNANRSGRKMGHINALGASPDKALALLKKRRPLFDL